MLVNRRGILAGGLGLALGSAVPAWSEPQDTHASSSDDPTEVVVSAHVGPPIWEIVQGKGKVWIVPYPDVIPKWDRWKPKKIVRYAKTLDYVLQLPIFYNDQSEYPDLLTPNPLADGSTLKDVVPSATFARFQAIGRQHGISDEVTNSVNMQPYLAGRHLEHLILAKQGTAFNVPFEGINRIIDGTQILHPRQVDQSSYCHMLRHIPLDLSVAVLEKDLNNIEYDLQSISPIYQAWKRSDLDTIEMLYRNPVDGRLQFDTPEWRHFNNEYMAVYAAALITASQKEKNIFTTPPFTEWFGPWGAMQRLTDSGVKLNLLST